MSTLLALAEDYYAANKQTVDALVAEVEAAGLDAGALDDLIHDAAANDDRDSREASNVNNQGLAFQVACILEGDGVEAGTTSVREAIAAAAPTP